MENSQKGFGWLKLLLVLIIAVVIGLIGWAVYDALKQDKNPGNSSSKSEVSSNADIYKDWQTYTSPTEKFSFKYPSSWTLTQAPESSQLKEKVSLLGPNKYILSYAISKVDPSATTPENRVKNATYDPNSNEYKEAQPLSIKNLDKGLYIVVDQFMINGQPTQGLGLAETKTYTQQKYRYPMYYEAKNADGYIVQWFGGHTDASGTSIPATSVNNNDIDVKNAILIFKSISY